MYLCLLILALYIFYKFTLLCLLIQFFFISFFFIYYFPYLLILFIIFFIYECVCVQFQLFFTGSLGDDILELHAH